MDDKDTGAKYDEKDDIISKYLPPGSTAQDNAK